MKLEFSISFHLFMRNSLAVYLARRCTGTQSDLRSCREPLYGDLECPWNSSLCTDKQIYAKLHGETFQQLRRYRRDKCNCNRQLSSCFRSFSAYFRSLRRPLEKEEEAHFQCQPARVSQCPDLLQSQYTHVLPFVHMPREKQEENISVLQTKTYKQTDIDIPVRRRDVSASPCRTFQTKESGERTYVEIYEIHKNIEFSILILLHQHMYISISIQPHIIYIYVYFSMYICVSFRSFEG